MIQPLKPAERPLEGWGCALVLFGFGAGFLAMGIGFWLDDPGWPNKIEALVLGAAAALLGMAGARVLRTKARFGPSSAAVTPCPVPSGQTFTFCYERALRKAARVERVLVALLARETFTTPGPEDGSSHRHVDRLAQQVEFSGRNYPRRAGVKCETPFQLLVASLPALNRGNAPIKWLIKVRLDLACGETFWEEYELPVAADVGGEKAGGSGVPDAPVAAAPVTPRFELVLWRPGNFLQMDAALRELLPHLDAGGIAGLRASFPNVVLEGATEAEVREAAAKLAATGAKVDIRFAATPLVPERRREPAPPSEVVAAAAPVDASKYNKLLSPVDPRDE